ncbi:MAG: arylsulfatase, partial [Planctomycetes bacterium]|nr:arylsulfatase [Planctomycetota bacterium]
MHGNPVLETPHLDRLAGESARLTEFYVHPVCTPTRSALMTGRHPQRTRAFDTYVGRAMLEPEEVTIAEVLLEAGWSTGIFGKWHLGDCAPMRPLDQGFERAVVHKGGGIGQPSDPLGAESKYTDPVLMDQGEEREFEGYCTDIYFDEAMKWMREERAEGERFFCYIAPNAPHTPLHDVPKALYEKYKAMDLSREVFAGGEGNQPAKIEADKLARLYAMIENIDENMGRLLRFLSEEELERDTLVVFLCDNGPQGRRYVQGFRGAKGNAYEGGVRSPLFMRWPGRLAAGDVEGDFGAHLDLFPTFLDACEVEAPVELSLDGRSLLPLLRGEESSPRGPRGVQWNRGDGPIKGQNAFVRDGRWKLVNFANAQPREEAPPWKPELYDLSQDPYEQVNVSEANAAVVQRMSAIYDEWFEDVGAVFPEENETYYRWERYGPPPIRIGGEGAERVVLTRQDWRRDQGGGWGQNGSWHVLFNDGGLFAPEQRPWTV